MIPTAQLGFAREPTQTDHAWMLAGAEASTRWVCLSLQPVCIFCQRPDLRLGPRQWALLVCTARLCEICCPAGRVQGTVTSWSCAVCAVSWPKGPILEDLAWMAAGLPAPSARGRQLHELRCSSVWRLPEGASPNRFGLWARAERASLEPAVAHKSH